MKTARLAEDFEQPGWWDVLRLRPYGETLLTPAVSVWLGFARVVILLMACIEAVVWGLVGASLVPEHSLWLSPLAGCFLFMLVFSIIWILDASLILSERPSLRARAPGQAAGAGALLRWFLGVLTRLVIVAVSLHITAPFLARLIRADDIEQYHQRQVERYLAERETRLEERLAALRAPIAQQYEAPIALVERDIGRLERLLVEERERHVRIENEVAPELTLLRTELVAAREQLGAEMHGREGRVPGYGPQARQWERQINTLESELAQRQHSLDERLAEARARIQALERERNLEQARLDRLQQERRQRLDALRAELLAAQPEADPPPLTFAARSQALRDLRASPAERGVPHFETVEGFAQALLAILFFALIALKLFEPPAVRAYFSESLQARYRQYLRGALAERPGFESWNDPVQRLDAVEFATLWTFYEEDPERFLAARLDAMRQREPLLALEEEQALRRRQIEQRHANLTEELELARQRRARELAAYERELELRIEQLHERLDAENAARLSQREEELEDALRQARETWELRKAEDEEALRQRRANFEAELEVARDERKQRLRELVLAHRQRMEELRQAELVGEQERLTRRLEARLREESSERETRLRQLREELNRLLEARGRLLKQQQGLRARAAELGESLEVATAHVRAEEQALAEQRTQTEQLAKRLERAPLKWPFWLSRLWADANPEGQQVSEARRGLRSMARDRRLAEARLERWRDERQRLAVRHEDAASALRENVESVAALDARIQYFEDHLATQLTGGKPRAMP